MVSGNSPFYVINDIEKKEKEKSGSIKNQEASGLLSKLRIRTLWYSIDR